MPTPSPLLADTHPPTPQGDAAAVFAAYPPDVREPLLRLRQLIFDTAARTEGVGEIEEALRWGEPSYLTTESKSGSTVRIGPVRGEADRYAVYVNCQTTLVGDFRQMYPDLFTYEGNRAITFRVGEPVPRNELGHCIAMALCYHLDKRTGPAS